MGDDEVVLLEESESFDLHDALYHGRCPDCYDPDEDKWDRTGSLEFTIDPDPDSPRYYADCPDCDDHFVLRPTAVTVQRYDH